MLTAAAAFNVVMIGVDVAAIVYLKGRCTPPRMLPVFVIAQMLAFLAAASIGPNFFGAIHLYAYALFAHGTILLTMFALMAWKSARTAALACLAAAAVLLLVAVDAFLLEPHWLEVTRVRVGSAKVTHPLTIAVVADLQTDRIGDYERRVLQRVMDERPDMILFAGDYLQTVDQTRFEQLADEMNACLHDLKFAAPLGVFAVGGNCDRQEWPEIFSGLPATVFTDSEVKSTNGIQVTGLQMEDSFDTRLRIEPAPTFHIVLGHAPDFVLGDVQADLLVAGHTHGGQVRLPLIGPLLTMSRVPRRWTSGVHEIRPGVTLIVPRGIGMERLDAPRLRFMCRPQLMFVEVVPHADAQPVGAGGE